MSGEDAMLRSVDLESVGFAPSTTPMVPVLDTVFDTLPSGLMLLVADGRIIRINQRGKELLGLPVDTESGHLRKLPAYLTPLATLLLDAKSDINRSEVVLALPTRPEENSTIGFSLKSIPQEGGRCILALTFTDITQVLKDRLAMDKIKDELNQSKKLASIGTMISGVAHELNNPLTGISMSAELSRMNLERICNSLAGGENQDHEQLQQKLDKVLAEVNKISKSCQKAAALVGDLLSYSKPTQLETEPTVLVDLVAETINAIKSHPQFSQFKMTLYPPETTYVVQADRVKLEQVFYNLFKNACDAVDGIGSLEVTFTVESSPQGAPWVTAHVKDFGPGIDKTVLGRIFDPFFSTKGNKGVGLGLSISYRTIEQHGGLLSVDSERGSWTEFKVALPIYNE